MSFDIDYVFPYVNNTEEVWIKSFMTYCSKINRQDKFDTINGQRYTDMGLLPILIKCIKMNMSWVRKIHIIVSNIEQLPQGIREDEKVNVVLHKDIIPSEYLPTFNSTTIEMFIQNIEGLAEHFIYGNDDMFPVSKLEPTDFFSEDGTKIKINFHKERLQVLPSQFRRVCYNNNKTLIKSFGLNTELKDREFFRPLHSITPMLKSHCIEVADKCRDTVYAHLNAFRTDKQHNQYIYPVYEYFCSNTESSSVAFKYVSCKNTVDEVVDAVLNESNQVVCINDTPSEHRHEIIVSKSKILEAFEKRLGKDNE